jgi:hypothetical protein
MPISIGTCKQTFYISYKQNEIITFIITIIQAIISQYKVRKQQQIRSFALTAIEIDSKISLEVSDGSAGPLILLLSLSLK